MECLYGKEIDNAEKGLKYFLKSSSGITMPAMNESVWEIFVATC